MKFKDYRISGNIKKSLDEKGFNRPTDIQYKAIPSILASEDVLAIAQTGTGKTAAFAIPILHLIEQQKQTSESSSIMCLVMVPTRELAMQITDVFKQLGKHTNIITTAIVGGVSQQPQIDILKSGTDVLVATPGRMFDLISQKHILLANVKALILDEADRMLDMGFIKDIRDVKKHLPRNHQTLFFSATIDKNIKKLAYSLVHNPIRIQISPKDPVAKNIDHSVAFIKMDDKRFFLERIINNNPESKVIVFVRTKVRAERVKKAMERLEIKSHTIHSDKNQDERFDTLNKFKSGNHKILIATDISARGIDIPSVDIVVNYDLPENPENYVHRVGRTGRINKKGQAISFCSPDEKKFLVEIEKLIKKEINAVDIDYDEYMITIESSAETHSDWKSLIRENEDQKKKVKKKKKKK